MLGRGALRTENRRLVEMSWWERWTRLSDEGPTGDLDRIDFCVARIVEIQMCIRNVHSNDSINAFCMPRVSLEQDVYG
jgi:hypothetical protein